MAPSHLRALRDRLRRKGEAAMRAMLLCPDWFQAATILLRYAGGGGRINRAMAPW